MKKLYLFLLLAINLIQPLSSMHVDPLDALYNICYVGFDDKKFLEIIHAYQATHEEALTIFANSKRPTPLLWAAINGNELMFKELLHYADFTNQLFYKTVSGISIKSSKNSRFITFCKNRS